MNDYSQVLAYKPPKCKTKDADIHLQLSTYLAKQANQGLLRQRHPPFVHGINFSSNDYLSLATLPKVQKAYQQGLDRYPVGSGGSMVVSGYHPMHRELEEHFAKALQVDDGILFSSGYAANLGIMHLLGTLKCHALIDKAVHASLYDGLKLAEVSYTRYRHHDLADLKDKLAADEHSVLITESIFSMSGHITPLHTIAQWTNKPLIVDEAHAFGLLGREGLGGVIQAELTQKEVPLRMIPFGKALASCGAIVVGCRPWIEALLQCARSYIYSTAMSPAMAYGILKTLEFLQEAEERREKLHYLIDVFRHYVANSSLQWRDSRSPIQQLQLGCPYHAVDVAEKLLAKGILCLPMRQPTVSKKDTGLRVILNHHHEPRDIQALFSSLHAHAL